MKQGFKLNAGVTAMNVYSEQQGVRERQPLTEQFSGTWSIGYAFDRAGLSIDYTGYVYSPMDLPTLTTEDFVDPRPAQSPWYSIQNLQCTKRFDNGLTCYAGAKNLDNQAERLILLAPHIFAEEKCVTAVEQAITAYENGKLRKALRKFHGKNTECAFRGWSGVWTDPEFSCWNIEEYLPFIKIPVLAIRGEDDPYNTIIHLDGITERVSGEVECFNLSNCAHAPHQEQEARVLRLIEKFLRACRN